LACTGPSACQASEAQTKGPWPSGGTAPGGASSPCPLAGGQLTGWPAPPAAAPPWIHVHQLRRDDPGRAVERDHLRIQPTRCSLRHDISPPAVACPARTACTAVGLRERRPRLGKPGRTVAGSRTSAAQTHQAPSRPRIYRHCWLHPRSPGRRLAIGAAAHRAEVRPDANNLGPRPGSNGPLLSAARPDRARGPGRRNLRPAGPEKVRSRNHLCKQVIIGGWRAAWPGSVVRPPSARF
jgi:hypothetical protein